MFKERKTKVYIDIAHSLVSLLDSSYHFLFFLTVQVVGILLYLIFSVLKKEN